MTTVQITLEKAQEIINSIPGGQFFSATFVTDSASSSVRKTDNPFWDAAQKQWKVKRRMKVSGRVGVAFANTRLYIEQNKGISSKPKRKHWAEKVGKLMRHKKNGTLYVPFVHSGAKVIVRSQYETLQGEAVDMRPYYNHSDGSGPKVLTPKLENLATLRTGGVVYEIVD